MLESESNKAFDSIFVKGLSTLRMLEKLKRKLGDSDSKEILAKGFSFLVLRSGGMFVGYLFTFFIARFYGASVNGLVALGFVLFLVFSIFGRLGLDINLVKFYSKDDNWKSSPGLFYKVLLKTFVFSSFLSICLYLSKTFIVENIFKKPDLDPYVFWVAITIPLWCITIMCSGLLRARQKNNWYAFLESPGRFSFTLIFFMLFVFLARENSLNAIVAHFFGILLLTAVALVKAIKEIGWEGRKLNNYDSKLFLKESLPMMFSGAIIVFLGWADTFVLGIYENENIVGVYSVVIKIAALVSFVLQAINSILMPKVSKLYSEGQLQKCKSLIRFSTMVNLILTVIIVLFILLGNHYLLAFFGEEFLIGTSVLSLLCVGQLINSLCGSVGVVLQMTGYQKVYRNIVFIALVVNIILNFTLVPNYGMYGVAIATIVSMSLWNIIGATYIKLKLDIDTFFNPFELIKKIKG